MGADRALHVEVSGSEYEGLLPLGVAKIFAALVRKEEANLVVLGKQVSSPPSHIKCLLKIRESTITNVRLDCVLMTSYLCQECLHVHIERQ